MLTHPFLLLLFVILVVFFFPFNYLSWWMLTLCFWEEASWRRQTLDETLGSLVPYPDLALIGSVALGKPLEVPKHLLTFAPLEKWYKICLVDSLLTYRVVWVWKEMAAVQSLYRQTQDSADVRMCFLVLPELATPKEPLWASFLWAALVLCASDLTRDSEAPLCAPLIQGHFLSLC